MKLKLYYIFFLIATMGINVYGQKSIKEIDIKIKQLDSLIEEGDEKTVLANADSIMRYSELANYKLGIAESFYAKGRIYDERDNFKLALENFKHALYVFEDLKEFYKIAKLQLNIGKIYSNIEEDKIALSYYFRAEKNGQRIGKKEVISIAYNNIANSYQRTNQFSQSYVYLKKSLDISLSLNDSISIARVYHNIGVNFEITDQNDSALAYFHKSLVYLTTSSENIGHAYNYLELGITYLKKNKINEAEKSMLKSLQICKNQNLTGLLPDVYSSLSNLFEQKKIIKKHSFIRVYI